MFKNYFKIAWRNFQRNKGYTFINIIGLAIGLAAFMLIFLYIQDELNFDRFNEKTDNIYRANMEVKFGDNHLDMALTNPLFGETAKNDLPQVEDFTRLRWYGGLLIKKGNENIRESDVAWADASLFNVFTLPMISGDPKTALTEPNSMVITETLAKKYFNTTDAAGKTLLIDNNKLRKVTGVIKDIPSNSHFRFTIFLPLVESDDAKLTTWAGSQNYSTYLLVRPGTDVNKLNDELDKMVDRNLGPELKSVINLSLADFKAQGDYFKTSLTALKDIHLRSNKNGELYGSGSILYVYIFSAIAFFILIIACINFMNLATARSTKRSREVGIRKVLGSLKSNLMGQFLSEAIFTCAIAMVLAFIIAGLSLSAFNELSGKQIDISVIFRPIFILLAVTLVLIVGFLAGLYPALYLSSFQPVKVLKSNIGSGSKKSTLRNALVIFQFTASIVLIAGTIVVYTQLKFIRSRDIGFNRQQTLIIKNTGGLEQKSETFKNELLQLNGVQKATVSSYLPVNYYRSNNAFFPDRSLDIKEAISMQNWGVDENYIPTLEMEIIEGRNFSKDMGTDDSAIIINETAAKFWNNKDILNKKIYQVTDLQTKEVKEYHVIGVVKDFNYASMRDIVRPLAFIYQKDGGNITVKVSEANLPNLLSQIKTKWNNIYGGLPFEYSFMEEDFNNYYTSEQKTGNLFTVFTILAIIIACMGLFGLATFMAEQRTKEIGIRKVLGASVIGISTMLSKDFVRLVMIAILIATPLAYYIMNQWLQAFAYRIEMEWWVFAITGVIAVGIAVATVSFQAVKAAIVNPIKSLRTE